MPEEGVFGSGEMDPKDWTEGESTTPEPQAQAPQQGEPAQGQPVEGNQAPQPSEGQPEPASEPVPQEGQPEPSQAMLAGKFKDPSELERGYKELEKTLGKQGDELSQLRQQNQQLYLYLQQMNNQQQQPVQQPQPQAQEQTDPQAWFDELQRKGPAAVQEIVNREVERQARQLGEGIQQIVAPLYQHYQGQQLQDQVREQIHTAAQKYSDFGEYAQDAVAVVKENPMLLTLPDGAERAYREAKLRRLEQQNQQQVSSAQKRAAQMPSTGASRPGGQQKSAEDIIRERIFGTANNAPGVFG